MTMEQKTTFAWIGIALFVLAIIGGFMWGIKQYKVYSKTMDGKAELREAEWSRQVMIEEAQANLEAEKLNAQAEVERAKGMAEAIRIEGNQLTNEYIQYLWVRKNQFDKNTTIYVPTETNLPILEAGRNNGGL